jgi:deleted-in-malignant-brain-tumors protein 1
MIYHFSTDPLVFGSAHFGQGTLPIHLDNVQCTGTEISLPQCKHKEFGSHNCHHGDDVGISCTPGKSLNIINVTYSLE